jgi:hypothetical protein
MNNQPQNALTFVQHLRTFGEPFQVRRSGIGVCWSDAAIHESAYQRDPELYALSGVVKRWSRRKENECFSSCWLFPGGMLRLTFAKRSNRSATGC